MRCLGEMRLAKRLTKRGMVHSDDLLAWTVDGPLEHILVSESDLQERVAEMGSAISAHYGDRKPVLVGVLTGAYVFMADLARAIQVPLEVEFMAISSYGTATATSGVVQIRKDLDVPIEGRDILIVEDIIDSGLTLRYLRDLLQRRNPRDIRIAALLRKDRPGASDIPVDWLGFDIPDEFVVGYGLDAGRKYRHLPFIATLNPERHNFD